jgi:pilus assembly protein CpaE
MSFAYDYELGSRQAIAARSVADKGQRTGEINDVPNRLGESHGGPVGTESKIIVFMHVSGGAGATTLAVNLGCALSQSDPDHETCLLDLDLQFGSAANFLDLLRTSPLAEFVEEPGRLDRAMLDDMLTRHACGLKVLTSPSPPLPLDALSPATVSNLLMIAKSRYRNVIVDMPVALTSWTDAVLKAANVIYLVTPMMIPAAHRIGKLLDLLRKEKLDQLAIKLVINRHDLMANRSVGLRPAEFAKATRLNLCHLIPDDYALVSLAEDQGTPALKLRPRSGFSLAIQRMADDLKENAGAQHARKFGLFGF